MNVHKIDGLVPCKCRACVLDRREFRKYLTRYFNNPPLIPFHQPERLNPETQRRKQLRRDVIVRSNEETVRDTQK